MTVPAQLQPLFTDLTYLIPLSTTLPPHQPAATPDGKHTPNMAFSDADRMYLVYEHKTNGRKLVPDGVSIMSEEDIVLAMSTRKLHSLLAWAQVHRLLQNLSADASTDSDIYMVIKTINPGSTHIDIYKADLLRDHEKAEALTKAKSGATDKVGGGEKIEEVPWKVFLGYQWEGHSFDELVILTPEKIDKKAATHAESEGTEGVMVPGLAEAVKAKA